MDDDNPHPSHELSRCVTVMRLCHASQVMRSRSQSVGRSGKLRGVPSRRMAGFFVGHHCVSFCRLMRRISRSTYQAAF